MLVDWMGVCSAQAWQGSAMASRRAPAHPAPRRPRAAAACRRWLPARRWCAVQGPVKRAKGAPGAEAIKQEQDTAGGSHHASAAACRRACRRGSAPVPPSASTTPPCSRPAWGRQGREARGRAGCCCSRERGPRWGTQLPGRLPGCCPGLSRPTVMPVMASKGTMEPLSCPSALFAASAPCFVAMALDWLGWAGLVALESAARRVRGKGAAGSELGGARHMALRAVRASARRTPRQRSSNQLFKGPQRPEARIEGRMHGCRLLMREG